LNADFTDIITRILTDFISGACIRSISVPISFQI